MLKITPEFKNKVVEALLANREHYEGADANFAKRWGMAASVWSRVKKGERDGLLKDNQWLQMGRELEVSVNERNWKPARTDVFEQISEEIKFCKANSKAMMFVDSCEIGKTFTAKYLSRTLESCFYIDASQCKTRTQFVRTMARTLGVDSNGKVADVKDNVKYYLRMLTNPVVVVDEAGDLETSAFLILKEMWNATENTCGWYMMGADGLKAKINRGIRNQHVGFRELFSRFSSKYSHIVPTDRQQKLAFYQKLITDVLSVNMKNKQAVSRIVKRCLTVDGEGNIGGLRRAESLLILSGEE